MKTTSNAIRPLRAGVSAVLAASLLTVGCDKSGTPGAPAEKAAAVAAPEAAATYGFLAKVPADVDAVSGIWRLEDLWDGFMKSRWLAELGNISALKEDADFQKFVKGEFPEEAKQPIALARAILGKEIVIVAAKGTAEKLGTAMKTLNEFQAAQMKSQVTLLKSAGLNPGDDAAKASIGEALLSILPSLEKLDVPPLFFVTAASGAKADIDKWSEEVVKEVEASPKPGVTLGTATVDGKHTLRTLKVDAAAIIAANEAQFSEELAKMVPDPEKAKQARAALEKKKVEVGWGWIGDHFLLSVGPDTSHVVLAAAPESSALSIPAIAKVAGTHAAKKPHSLGFARATLFDAVALPFETANLVEAVTGIMGEQLPAGEPERMVGEAKEFDAKYAPQMKQTFEDIVSVDWWEGGLRSEVSGGRKHRAEAKPLELAGTLNGKSLLHLNSRTEPGGVNWRAFVEDLSVNVWGWYVRGVKPSLPQEAQMQSAMAETMGLAVIKELWRAGGLISEALGDESAIILDTDGTVAEQAAAGFGIPDTVAKDARIPRLGILFTVKNRAKLGEAWTIINGLITQFSAFIPEGQFDKRMLQPLTKKEGTADIHWLPVIPMDTGDVLPHVAVTDTRFVIGTSPLLSSALAVTTPATDGPTAWHHWRAQPPALADLIKTDIAAASTSPEIKEKGDFETMQADMAIVDKLIRSFTKIDLRTFDEGGTSRVSFTVGLEDVK